MRKVKQTNKVLVLLGIAMLLAINMSPLVISAVATDGPDEELQYLNERELTVTDGGSSVTIYSKLQTGTTQDEFKLEIIAADDGLEFKMDYNSESEDLEIELSFTVDFYAIIEYVDVNADGIYNPGNDTFVKAVQIGKPFLFGITTETTADNKTIYIINATMENGLFSVQLYAVENWEFINGTWISPTETKFDIAIHSFNYTNGESDLALSATLVSSTEYEREEITDDEAAGYSSDEEEVETTTNGFTGFFSWTNTALIDGIEKQVKLSPLGTSGEDEILYLNYPRGINIIHDPKIGIDGILKMPADYTIFVIVGIIAVVAVVLAIFFIRRGKNA